MEIGEPERIVLVEPLDDGVPLELPLEEVVERDEIPVPA